MNASIDWEDPSMLTSYPPIADGELDSIPWPQHPRPTLSHGVQFCSGTGQHDTRQSSGDDYDLISWAKIVDMAVHPTTVDKAVGRWFIPSTYNQSDARSFQRQSESGTYHAIPVDIDCGNHSLQDVTEATQAVLGDCFVIHSSRSSKPDNRKWRVIAMLSEPLAGSAYGHIQRAVIDLYQERGFTLDPALERAAQLIYLPNAGEFYQHHVSESQPTDLARVIDRATSLMQQNANQRAVDKRRQMEEAKQREANRKRLGITGSDGIDGFNREHDIQSMLVRYGFKEARGGKWISPYSKSKKPKVRVYPNDNRASSYTAGDEEHSLGKPARKGGVTYSPFDLYAHFEHNNDTRAALIAATQKEKS